MSTHKQILRRFGPAIAFRSVLWLTVGFFHFGCGFLIVRDTPERREYLNGKSKMECASHWWPAGDAAIAAFELYRTAFAMTTSDNTYAGFKLSRSADVGLGIGFLALFGASAIVGSQKIHTCQAEIARQMWTAPYRPAPYLSD